MLLYKPPFLKAILFLHLVFIPVFALFGFSAAAQQITGVWKGKIKGTRVELKLVKSGDSLVGNAYYYTSKNNYRKYSLKGYFDPGTNNVIWWDNVLVEDKTGHGLLSSSLPDPMLTVADFNCPGESEMRLDGSSSLRDDKENRQRPGQPAEIGHAAVYRRLGLGDWIIIDRRGQQPGDHR